MTPSRFRPSSSSARVRWIPRGGSRRAIPGAGPRARRAGRGRPFLYGLRRHPARTVLRRPPDRRPVRRRHRHSQPGAVVATQGSGAPVLALAEDGSAVLPLLGGLAGVNRLAREIGEVLAVAPAITTSGELRFGTCVCSTRAGLRPGRPGAGRRCRFARWPAGARRGCRRLARRGPFAARPGGGAGDSRDALGARRGPRNC